MNEGPYYIVKAGTNIRNTLHGKDVHTPKIYDTAEIAQEHIDKNVDYRRRVGLSPTTKVVPVSVAEYDEKYSELMKVN